MEPVGRQVARLRLGDAGDRRQRHGRRSSARCRRARARAGKPQAIVLRTLPGKGVPTLEKREKAHFVRVDPGEWDELDRRARAKRRRPWLSAARTLAMGQDEATGTSAAPASKRRSGRRWSRLGARAAGDRRADRRPRQVHRHPAVPRRVSRPLLQCRHGRAEPRRRRRRPGADRARSPFATTYGVFATRRAYDFIAIACAHSARQREDLRRPARA